MKKHTSPETLSRKCPSGTRNRYFRKKEMGAEEFRVEQEYFLERRRLINRSVHGWGVVSGFGVDPPDQGELGIKPGVALDRHGRELLLCDTASLKEGNTFVYPPNEGEDLKPLGQAQAGRYLLRAHYAEREFEDVPTSALCGCGQIEKNYVCETVIFSLEPLDHGKCRCEEPHCHEPCACGQGKCDAHSRGPHRCLSEWIAGRNVSCASSKLCRWKRYRVDPCDGVALACIVIERTNDECKPIAVKSVDADPRRLVKNNDLLYDLIRGCDLTTIAAISWSKYHRSTHTMPLSWIFGVALTDDGYEDKPVPTKLEITFSAPVLVSTLTVDCVSLRITVWHTDTGWHDRREVKLDSLEPLPQPGDPAGTTTRARIWIAPDWFGEVRSKSNLFQNRPKHDCVVSARIEILGDYILDCRGQAVDANAIKLPSGNGTPGGTFVSVFRIDPHKKDDDTQQAAQLQRNNVP